tara:strand:+ start:3870 stop:4253 length:384 start_codon:yes stop_codon:yes gene_type:complete
MKLGSKIIMMLAYSFCYVWHKVRCRAFRRIDDFNYHVFAIDANPQLPFYKKIVEINNVFEKTVSVKIADVCIRFSIDKTLKHSDVIIEEIPEWAVKRALTKSNEQHHKATVHTLNREGSDVKRSSRR